MYEPLTSLIPRVEAAIEFDERTRGGASADEPAPGAGPYAVFDDLWKATMAFVDVHPEMGLHDYADIIGAHGIDWSYDPMVAVDASTLDGRTVAALLVAAYRADHFCEGVFADFVRSGAVLRWLERLEEIDRGDGE